MPNPPSKPRKPEAAERLIQYASMPYRIVDGHPMVLLVTSRETKRWILPKGNPEKKMAPHQVAELEAFEEAGVKGKIKSKPFASFPSVKRLKSGKEIPCDVQIYLLEVREELPKWPEKGERDRRWMSFGEAAMISGEPGLVQVLLDFGATFGD